MRSTKESITLPLLRSRGEVLMLGWMLLPMGLVLALTLVLEPVHPLGIVINGMMALGLTAAGAALILACSMRLHLVPEGAAVSLFGRTLARYPAESLTVIRWDKDQMNGPRLDRLVLSALSLEELAERRERKLRSSGYYASGVDRRKLRSDWQATFALEQIQRMTRLGQLFPVGRRVLWLQDSRETMALLQMAYPGAAWHDLRRGPDKSRRSYREKPQTRTETPQRFQRAHQDVMDGAGSILMVLIFLIPSPVFVVLGTVFAGEREELSIIGSCLGLVWMFGSLIYMGMFMLGHDWLSAEDAGLRIRKKGGKERLIPADDLKTAWRIRLISKGGPLTYLVICTHTRQELVQMKEERMSKTRRGREELSALGLLESWPELAVRRLLLRRMTLLGYDDPLFLLVGSTDDREKWITERYPQMEVYDLTE